jgi:hypothetical protein
MSIIPTLDINFLSDADLVDEAAKLDLIIKSLTKKLDEAKLCIRARQLDEICGTNFKAVISTPSIRWTLNTDRVKKEMGEAWYTERCKISQPLPAVSFKPYMTLDQIKIA